MFIKHKTVYTVKTADNHQIPNHKNNKKSAFLQEKNRKNILKAVFNYKNVNPMQKKLFRPDFFNKSDFFKLGNSFFTGINCDLIIYFDNVR